MSSWLYDLPAFWLIIVVFLGCAAIFAAVQALAVGGRAQAFTSVSAGMLSPLGVLFGLLVGFVALQVGTAKTQAELAVGGEASAWRATIILADRFPAKPRTRLHTLIRHQIQAEVAQEWPAMAEQRATLAAVPQPVTSALNLVLGLSPHTRDQQLAQSEMLKSLQDALDARRQRIVVSQSSVEWVKWTGLVAAAALTLLTIAVVNSNNRLAAAIALAIFGTGVAVSLLLIVVEDRPFAGPDAIQPTPLVQVMPPAH